MTLRLGHHLSALRPSLTNGPGWRVSVWVQGCSLRCTTECLNPHLLESGGGHLVAVDELVGQIATIRSQRPKLEGISVLGGEPLDQAVPIAELFEQIHSAGLSTMLYTGYTVEAVRARRSAVLERLLQATDILLDGPFLPAQYSATLAWRGSRNQRLICLSNRYNDRELAMAYERQGKAFSLQISATGWVSASGLQNRDGADQMERLMRNS